MTEPDDLAVSAAASPAPSRGHRRWLRIALALLLVWAAAVRLWHGSFDLDSTRFWDERFGVENVMGVLAKGELRPQNGFHPSLSYLPHLAVLATSQQVARWTGWQSLEVLGPRGFTPTAYLLCRWTQTVFGVLSLWLLFLVGRRLFDESTAVLAVGLLAAAPWHLRQSAVFKPDIVLVLTMLLAFLLSLRAIDDPRLRRFLIAGAAIGLALSSKFNAGPIAIPLAMGAAVLARGRWRILLWLGAAGCVALGTFLVLNPYTLLEPQIYTSDFSRTLADYAHKGATRARGSHLLQLVHFGRSMLSAQFHGYVVGGAAVLALPLLAGSLMRRRDRDPRVLGGWMLLSYVAGYLLLYSLTTANPTAHNWLPVAPFTALAASWLLVTVWRMIRRRVPFLSPKPLAALPALVLGPWLVWSGTDYAYRNVLPSTSAAAGNYLKQRMPHLGDRIVVGEVSIPVSNRQRGGARLTEVVAPRLAELDAEVLDAADVELFPASRLDDPETSPFYARRVRAMQHGLFVRIEPRLLRAHGPELVMLVHPFRRGQSVVRGQLRRVGAGHFEIHPPGGTEHWISLRVAMPRGVRVGSVTTLAAGRTYDCVENRVVWNRQIWLCPRVRRVSELQIAVREVSGGPLPRVLDADVMSWSRSRPTPRRDGPRGSRVRSRNAGGTPARQAQP